MKAVLWAAVSVFALLFFTVSASAQAQPPVSMSDRPLYLSLGGGYVGLLDNEGTVLGVPFELDYEAGFGIFGALGYKRGPWRGEIEFSYASTEPDTLSVLGTTVDVGADIDLYVGTLNLFYDFYNETQFTPYVGGGVGAIYQDLDGISATVGATTINAGEASETDLIAFGEAGFTVKVNEAWAIVPAYRFAWVDNGGSGGGVTADDDMAHIFKVGARYHF